MIQFKPFTTMATLACAALSVLTAKHGQADEILTCVEEVTTTIAWEEGGILKRKGMHADVSKSKEPMAVTLVLGEKKGILKGNGGQTPLVRLDGGYYLEQTGSGNIFLWSVLRGRDGLPTYVFQHKAYNLSRPFSITACYKCN